MFTSSKTRSRRLVGVAAVCALGVLAAAPSAMAANAAAPSPAALATAATQAITQDQAGSPLTLMAGAARAQASQLARVPLAGPGLPYKRLAGAPDGHCFQGIGKPHL